MTPGRSMVKVADACCSSESVVDFPLKNFLPPARGSC